MADALCKTMQLQAFRPDLLISAGTAGGFKAQGGAIGDVYISKAVMHHDRRIPIPVSAQRCNAVSSFKQSNLQQLPHLSLHPHPSECPALQRYFRL